MMAGFLPFDPTRGMLAETGTEEFATTLSAWNQGHLELGPDGTHFGYVWNARARLSCAAGVFELSAGMYFAVPGAGAGGEIVVTRWGHRGLFTLGGPIEAPGRLRYIDGCTDSLLVPPVLRGDACLNALYFPPSIDQTEHTHPSDRMGLVASGRGMCLTPGGDFALDPGRAFIIPAGARHRFRTAGETMTVIAYHPDSDFGPTHEAHP